MIAATRLWKWSKRWLRERADKNDVDITFIAESYWFREIQSACFAADIDALSRGKEPPRDSKLIGFRAYIDSEGLLRARGRVTAIHGPEFENTPIILDGNHYATKLLIASYHRKYLHENNETIINELRQRFHIIGFPKIAYRAGCGERNPKVPRWPIFPHAV